MLRVQGDRPYPWPTVSTTRLRLQTSGAHRMADSTTTTSTTPSNPAHARIVLKVWENNGVLLDNAADIAFLEASGWKVHCTEKLCSDGPDGKCAILYVMEAKSLTPAPAAFPAPQIVNVPVP